MINHISSGGFIFYRESRTAKLYVALIVNKNNQIWIPKGHVETGENSIETAYREIREEIGLKKENLKYVDFIFKDSYFWKQDGQIHSKNLDIHLFESIEKQDFTLTDETHEEIDRACWFLFEDAINNITYNKNELLLARQIYFKNRNFKKYTDISEIKKIVFAIPTYNGGKTIKNTLISLLDEIKLLPTHIDCSIVVGIDHCSDNTLVVVKDFLKNYEHIDFYINDGLQGKTNVLNLIYSKSSADILYILDDDIIFKHGSVFEIIENFTIDKNMRILFSQWERIPYSGNNLSKKFWNYILGIKFQIQPYVASTQILKGSSMAMRWSDYISLPTEKIFNEDQYLQYAYYPFTLEVKKSIVYFNSVSTLFEYYERFKRILRGDFECRKYFTKKWLMYCDKRLKRKINHKKILSLPLKQFMAFYFYILIRIPLKFMAKNQILEKKDMDWFRFKVH